VQKFIRSKHEKRKKKFYFKLSTGQKCSMGLNDFIVSTQRENDSNPRIKWGNSLVNDFNKIKLKKVLTILFFVSFLLDTSRKESVSYKSGTARNGFVLKTKKKLTIAVLSKNKNLHSINSLTQNKTIISDRFAGGEVKTEREQEFFFFFS